jgi:DNA-directed RNA polymerase specialized sigma24 family protein
MTTTRRRPLGRPIQEVDPDTVKELTRIRNQMVKAEAAVMTLQGLRDEAISRAYMGGTNKNRIADLVGVTVKTVDASLVRSGTVEERYP